MNDLEHDREIFRAYHRVERQRVLVKTVIGGIVAAVVVTAVAVSAVAAAPAPGPSVVAVRPSATAAAAVLPAGDAAAAASATPQPLTATETGPRDWAITIDTTGYQKEIDQCLWVRMDLGLDAPVVGAHNYCGGSVVLEMAVGDTVTLSGTGLDGTYLVSAERLAWAGDNAASATAGLDAVVILQTCFWVDDGSERLLALVAA